MECLKPNPSGWGDMMERFMDIGCEADLASFIRVTVE